MIRTDKEQAFKYLLGDLTEVERNRVEERFFTDENFSQIIDDAENDLIDEFARGELSGRELLLFSRNFLVSDRRREKARAAQIMQRELFADGGGGGAVNSVSIVSEKAFLWQKLAGFMTAPQIAFASLAILLLIFCGWYGLKNRNTPAADGEVSKAEETNLPALPITRPAANIESSQITSGLSGTNKNSDKNVTAAANKAGNTNQPRIAERLPKEQKTKTPGVQATFASLLLLPMTRSSSQNQTLNLKADVKAVNLRIVNDREEDFDRFRVEVRNIDGVLIVARDFKNTNYNRKSFNLQIASEKLAAADYQVTLKGADVGAQFQSLNYFYFSIEKK